MLSVKDGAEKLYELFCGRPAVLEQLKPEHRADWTPVFGSISKPLPYRHKLIGVGGLGRGVSREEKREPLSVSVNAEAHRAPDARLQLCDDAPLQALPVPVAPVAIVARDKYGKPIKECLGCQQVKSIIGRGLCMRCYWQEPDIKEKARARRATGGKRRGGSLKCKCGKILEKNSPNQFMCPECSIKRRKIKRKEYAKKAKSKERKCSGCGKKRVQAARGLCRPCYYQSYLKQ